MTYKEALAEILGKEHPALSGEWVGGVYDCPADAFIEASRECPNEYCGAPSESCRACWNREYEGEEFNPTYWED